MKNFRKRTIENNQGENKLRQVIEYPLISFYLSVKDYNLQFYLN